MRLLYAWPSAASSPCVESKTLSGTTEYPPFKITYGPTRHDMRYTLAEVEVLPTVPPELRKTHRIGMAWPYPASSRPRARFLSFLSCVVPAPVKRALRAVVPSR